jgi:hypothetical protein
MMEAVGVFMTKKIRRRFFEEFKADAASLVIDQGYSVFKAAPVCRRPDGGAFDTSGTAR